MNQNRWFFSNRLFCPTFEFYRPPFEQIASNLPENPRSPPPWENTKKWRAKRRGKTMAKRMGQRKGLCDPCRASALSWFLSFWPCFGPFCGTILRRRIINWVTLSTMVLEHAPYDCKKHFWKYVMKKIKKSMKKTCLDHFFWLRGAPQLLHIQGRFRF